MAELGFGRAILFTDRFDRMRAFYEQTMGMPVTHEQPGYVELGPAGAGVALHARTGNRIRGSCIKLAFYTEDVAAARAELNGRGAKFREVKGSGGGAYSDGRDPDGNPIQLSNRR